MEDQARLRVGIVGCGYQGGIMARTSVDGNTMQVTACADPDQNAAAEVANLLRLCQNHIPKKIFD